MNSCYSLTWLQERAKLACGWDDKQDFVRLQVYFEKQIEGKKCGINVEAGDGGPTSRMCGYKFHLIKRLIADLVRSI